MKVSDALNKTNKKDDLYVITEFNGRDGMKRTQLELLLGNFGGITTEGTSNRK